MSTENDLLGPEDEIEDDIEEKECPVCGGDGTIECSNCGGSGTCECMDCESDHDCGKCDGDGTINCKRCDGDGFIEVPRQHVDPNQLTLPGVKES